MDNLPKNPGLARRLAYGEFIRQSTTNRLNQRHLARFISTITFNYTPAPDEDFLADDNNVSTHTSTLTYEQLISLEDIKTGLKIKDVNCNSKVYIKNKKIIDINICTICQDVFKTNNEIIRELNCGHPYHLECIDRWFEDHIYCPICKHDFKQS